LPVPITAIVAANAGDAQTNTAAKAVNIASTRIFKLLPDADIVAIS
jgi:hypothetical protein